MVYVVVNDVDSTLIEIAPLTNVASAVGLCETFAKVEAETIEFIVLQPMLPNLFYEITCSLTFMVEIIPNIERMSSYFVKPRAFC